MGSNDIWTSPRRETHERFHSPNASGTRTTLTWELDPDGDHALLRFTNTVAPPEPSEDAGAADTTTAAGWHLHLDALATVLSGGEVDIAHPEPVFEPIHQAYTEQYGSQTG